jgi:serine protease Do
MNRVAGALAALTGVVGFLIGLVMAAGGSRPASPGTALKPHGSTPLIVTAEPPAVTVATPGPLDFAAVAARVNPAVVNVDAAVRGDSRSRSGTRWGRDIVDGPGAPREGSGSGFFIDSSGYLVTNFHVIDGADRLTVTLGDGRSFRAELVGVDPAIDIALLKIPSTERLPVAVLGNSDSLKPGQWVCAIGNPLGYVHSVTVGVISFLGRKLFDPSLDAYIQTDAAISLGNSGGPLIDAQGHVVGITTAISAQAANIGFAIPINQVIPVLEQLRERGRVSRGSLGVGLTAMTPALRVALGVAAERGAVVQDVTPDTPAERAGLRAYDVIVSVDDVPVRTDDELIRAIAGRMPGTVARLGIVRDAEARSFTVKLTERPVRETRNQSGAVVSDARPAVSREHGLLGLTVRDLDGATVARQQIPDGLQGVTVIEVDPAGPARLARLRPGQLILEINRTRVASAVAFQAIVAGLKPGRPVAILLFDPLTGQRQLLTVTPDSAP